jgi:hypothetical protein
MMIVSSSAWAFAPADEVTLALDQYESGGNTVSRPPAPTLNRIAQNLGHLVKEPPIEDSSPDPLLSARKPHETEMGLETYGYKYLETVDGGHFMDLKGPFFGFFVNHTFRPNQLDPFFAGFVNMFRLEFRYARAKLKYTGGVQFGNGDTSPLSMAGIPDWVAEARAIMGLDVPFHGMMVTPFTGLGIRGLEDDASKVTGTFDNGGTPDTISGYKRISHYYYLPFGVDIEKSFAGAWKARLTMEYDFLLSGMQKSYSPGDISYGGVDYHYDSITNKQTKGYGMRASLNLRKDMKQYGLFLEPFYRFWKIGDSQLAHVNTPDGYEFVGIAMEPSNTTREVGVKMGVVF